MKTLGIIFSNIHDKDVSELTAMRTLASVPFGGRYRLIDFVLSNMVNSGILNIGVITKYNYQSLMEHIGSGKSWDLSRKNGGITILPPFGTETAKVYSSRFEAISNASYFLRKATETYVVMSDCDNVCNIDFSDVLQYHIAKHADITVVYRQKEIVPGDTKVRTALTIDGDGRVTKVVTGGRHRGVINSFTNMLIMSRQFLLNIIDSSAENGFTSFSRDVLIKGVDDMRIYGYKHCGYFGSIDSLPNYFKHSMQLLEKPVREELFRKNGAGIYTKVQDSAPLRLEEGSDSKNSLIADGCVIKGKVYNSILFRGVKVEKGAEVSNSIIFQDVTIGENSSLNCVISDSGVKVLENRRLSGHETHPYYITKNTTI